MAEAVTMAIIFRLLQLACCHLCLFVCLFVGSAFHGRDIVMHPETGQSLISLHSSWITLWSSPLWKQPKFGISTFYGHLEYSALETTELVAKHFGMDLQ
jgi:hypothetical protein